MSKQQVDFAKKIVEWRENPVTFVREVFAVEPDPWQIDFLMAFSKSERLALKACKGPGKAMHCSMEFYTPNGLRKWGDLEVGDLVFAEGGTPTEIKGVYPQGVRPIYRMTFDDGTFVDCDLGHLWKVRGRTEKRKTTWVVKETKDLIGDLSMKQGETDYFQYQIPLQGMAQFPEKDLPVNPYVLGAWIGDGSRGQDIISSTYPDLVENLKKHCPDLKSYASSIGHKLNLYQQFKKLEVLKCYSYEKYIPEIYKTASIEQRKNLLAGLMDTDGTIDRRDRTWAMEYSTTSPQLAQDVAWLVRSLGGKVQSIGKKVGKLYGVEHRLCYRVRVTLPFNPFKVEYKAKFWKPPTEDRYLYRTIKEIKYVRDEEASCIEVAHESHCYLANDFIVTHNTCALAWVAWNFLATRPSPKIAATSITSDNLSDGLWAEMAKWMHRSPFLKENFEWLKTRIVYKHKPETWFMSARTWPKTGDPRAQADTLAGLHADYLLFLIDEAGGVPDSVMAAAEAGLSTGIETKICIAGNPTHLSGPLYRACNQERHLWHVQEISGDPDDPKRATRIKIDWARNTIAKYGKNNPWVLVNVFGKFPPSSLNSLVGQEEVRDAMNRVHLEHEFSWSQRRLGIDVARFGDDSTLIFPRQGLCAFPPVEMRNANTLEISARVQTAKAAWGSEAEFVDDTGGFGGGVIDNLQSAGHDPVAINFSSRASDPRYFNLRSEMYFRMADWIKRGGALPDIPELVAELTSHTYTFHNGKLKLDSKAMVKEAIGRSPDHADALALTFAWPDLPTETMEQRIMGAKSGGQKVLSEYDPLEDRF